MSDCQIENSSTRDLDTSHPTPRNRTKSSESTSTSVLASLLERYERTLCERERTTAFANEEFIDIDDVIKRYRAKIQNSAITTRSNTVNKLIFFVFFFDLMTMRKKKKHFNRSFDLDGVLHFNLFLFFFFFSTCLYENRFQHLYISFFSFSIQTAMELCRVDYPTISITNLIKDKYRSMPAVTSEEMIHAYIPSPRLHLATSIVHLPRERLPRFALRRPDYCDLCLTDHSTSSAWIRYNERRIEELQKRIDIMLQIDDTEEAQFLLAPDYLLPSTTVATVSQRIDDLLATRIPWRYYYDRFRKSNLSGKFESICFVE